MAIESIERGRSRGLAEHLELALQISQRELETIRDLVDQVDGCGLLPILGAGASYDCGVRQAGDLSEKLYETFSTHPKVPSDVKERTRDLGAVADAFALLKGRGGHKAAVEALGLGDPNAWPGADGFEDHFCAYRVLARLAREDFIDEAATFNYDCGFEHALRHEGFTLAPRNPRGRRWRDEATAISDSTTNAELRRRGQFVLNKIHGCAARYREASKGDPKHRRDAANSIILRWAQLLDWRDDHWARDALSERARRNTLLLMGFSAQDPVIHIGLTRVLEDACTADRRERPRVVVFDRDPDSLALRLLAHAGIGRRPRKPDEVVRVSVEEKSGLTATLIALHVELMNRRLARPLGTDRPATYEEALAMFVVNVPAMLRWSFLLDFDRPEREWGNRVTLHHAPGGGYVPITIDPDMTVNAVAIRRRLLESLGGSPRESIPTGRVDGFVLDRRRGRAYMPTTLTASQLAGLVRRPAEVRNVVDKLATPRALDQILVADADGRLKGLSLGRMTPVPVP